MTNTHQEQLPKISLTTLAALCFVTLVMCQTRFKISKEINREVCYDPPVLRSRDCWFLYTIGNPNSFKCVLRIFVVITSPMLSLISTALLLFGKLESNPYFFIPWLFLTVKGLLLVQTDNLITILRDMSARANYTFGFRLEDLKWIIFYLTIFMIDLMETFSFCEIFELFMVLWNNNTKSNFHITNIETVKRDIADIMKSLSKCSLGSFSKLSLASSSDSAATNETNVKELESVGKTSAKEEDGLICPSEPTEALSKGDSGNKSEIGQSTVKGNGEGEMLNRSQLDLKPTSEGDGMSYSEFEKFLMAKDESNIPSLDTLDVPKVKLKTPLDIKQELNQADLLQGVV